MTERVLTLTPAAVLDALSRAVIATDTAGHVVYWNKGAERLYGWRADEVLGREIVELLVPQSLVSQATEILEKVGIGEDWSGEFLIRHKDGHTHEIAIVHRAVFDDQGHITAVVGESEDVSAERRLASQLRTTRDEQRLALAAGRLGILRWDRDTSTVSLDETAETLLGLQPGTFEGTSEAWFSMLHPDDRDRVRAVLDRALETKGSYDLEYRVIWPDGSVHWLQGRGQVTIDDAGNVTGRIGCMTDITARRLADEERAHLLAVERATRAEAETVAMRLRGLQDVTMSLIRAVDARSVAEAVLTEGVPALGGRTGSILLVAEDAESVEIVHEVGYRDEIKARWHSFPLAASLPASDAIRNAELVLLTSQEDRDARYPVFRDTPMRDAAVAVAPLIDEDGTAFGAMVIGFPEPREFSGAEQRIVSALAAQCATALRRAVLYEDAREAVAAEREARMAAERSQERLTFLAEASSTLASSVLDLETTLAQVVDLAVPRLADGCAIQMVDERGHPLPVALAHVDPAKLQGLRLLIEDGAGDAGSASVVAIPLHSQNRTVGVLTLVTETGRTLEEADLQLAEQLAVRAGTAIENARLFADRSRVARSLQASLLPPSLPSIPGLELGARYAPAGEGVEVGGDFYGPRRSTAGAGSWWSATCGARASTPPPSPAWLATPSGRSPSTKPARRAILAHLNRVLLSAEADRIAALQAFEQPAWELTEPRFCTVAVAIIEPRPGGAGGVVCSGGHPLPLVARADGRVEAVGRPGSLIGASPEIQLHDVDFELGPGDALVCFTDGIVERHRGREFFEEVGIAKVLTAGAGADAATLAARIEDEARNLFADNPHDDMAVLIVRVPPQ